jgi:nitrogen-specific signal transduction histidine kinase
LTQQEFALLEYLCRNAGRVVTRSMVLDHVWKMRFNTSTNIVDVHIHRLRNKVDRDSDRPLIKTMLLAHVFQRFAKGDKSEGHWLGLAFVRAVALAHGGRTWVRNLEAPGGAEIVIEFPTFTPNQPPDLPQAGSLERSAGSLVTETHNDVIVTSS